MNSIGAKLTVFAIKSFSRLPFWFMYGLSDVLLFPALYYVIGYRRKVVAQNLKHSFPNKSDAELKRIEKKYYHHLCDLTLESIKVFTITEEELNKRLLVPDGDLINSYLKQGKHAIILFGHIANWEYAASLFPSYLDGHSIGVYKPIKNKAVEKVMLDARALTGMNLIPTSEISDYLKNYELELPWVMALIADQSPSPKKAFWLKWLNQNTGFFMGPELLSRKYNTPVFYWEYKKIKRGHYSFTNELLVEDASELPYGTVIEKYAERLEQDIEKNPELWIWSHKRWKHELPEDINPDQLSKTRPVTRG